MALLLGSVLRGWVGNTTFSVHFGVLYSGDALELCNSMQLHSYEKESKRQAWVEMLTCQRIAVFWELGLPHIFARGLDPELRKPPIISGHRSYVCVISVSLKDENCSA